MQNCIAYSKWGLKRLVYRGRTDSLFLKIDISVYIARYSVTFPCIIFHCWDKLKFDSVVTPRFWRIVYTFKIHIVHFRIKFLFFVLEKGEKSGSPPKYPRLIHQSCL